MLRKSAHLPPVQLVSPIAEEAEPSIASMERKQSSTALRVSPTRPESPLAGGRSRTLSHSMSTPNPETEAPEPPRVKSRSAPATTVDQLPSTRRRGRAEVLYTCVFDATGLCLHTTLQVGCGGAGRGRGV